MSLNVKGQLKEAQVENLSSDPANLPHGRTWYNTTLNKIKASIAGVAKIIPTTDSTDTLTNKTIDADANTITNIENADIKAGAAIDASKIADGSVTSTEFQYINTLSSNAQDQLNSKLNASFGIVSDVLSFTDQGSDPSAPSSGFKNLYAKATGLFFRNSAGTVFQIQTAASTPITVQKFTSGSGTYTTPAGVKYIKVTAVGGGGGGLGSNLNTANNLSTTSLTNGSSTTFGSSLITANGGSGAGGATYGLGGGAGGSGTITTSSSVLNLLIATGGTGGHGTNMRSTTDIWAGSTPAFGGGTLIAPHNTSGAYGQTGVDGTANTGQGGGGAGLSNVANSGRMGGAGGGGGTCVALITSPSASYSYSIGAGGTGATGDSYAGGAGGSGIVIVEEYY